MIELALNKVYKNFGFNDVLDGVSLEVHTKDRVAIVGKNGSGKTTLFRIIKGLEVCTSGDIMIRKNASIGLLEQIPPLYEEGYIVKDLLLSAFNDVFEVVKRMELLEVKMANNEDINNTMKKYGHAQELFNSLHGYEVEANISKICAVFKISDELLSQTYETLSGGQKTSVHLAYLLLSKPDILLLDEPTNHLDVNAIEWLENYLKEYNGTVIISSHDRYFLDKVVDKIIHLEDGECKVYFGNYSKFVVTREKELLAEFEQYKVEQRRVKAMEDAIKRYRDWGTISGNGKFFKAAANIEKRIERMELLDKPKIEKDKLPLNFVQKDRTGHDVVITKDLTFSYGEKKVLNGTNLEVYYGENVCLMGNNGSGKTTLIKILLGEIKDYNGTFKLGSNVKVGYLSQHVKFDDEKNSVYDEFRRHYVGDESKLRATLVQFNFYGDMIQKRIEKLSGGEKVRLKFAELIQNDVNFLILDEPTNHIDIDTREMLEEALLEFKGTILFVSHDRYFINKIAHKVSELKDGKIKNFVGNYDYYNEHKDIIIDDKPKRERYKKDKFNVWN